MVANKTTIFRTQVTDSLNLQCLLMLFIQEKDVICNRKRHYKFWELCYNNVVTYG